MATPTAPTVALPAQGAAPGPTAGTGPAQGEAPAAPSGPLSSILAPVQPARPAAPIGTTASLPQETAATAGGGSTKTASPAGRDNGQDGPVGALVRAIADRLRRTGTASTIKRQHTVTETRTSGNSSNTTNANRSDRSAKSDRSAQHRSNRDAKMADLNNKASQHQSRSNQDVKKAGTIDAKTSDAKAVKRDHASKTGKDNRDSRDVKASDARTAKADTAARTSRDDKHHDVKSSTSAAKTPGGAQPVGAKTSGATDSTAKTSTAAQGKDNATEPADTKPGADGQGQSSTPRPRTQSSREAGYRDGQRAAATVGHVKAWRDGTQDGYADRTAANEAERKKMDDAKAKNALRPTTRAAAGPAMTPASGSTVDLAKKDKAASPAGAAAAVPVQVTSVGKNAVNFNAAGVPHTMSRAEVRTLKQFERRLDGKHTTLAKIADSSKATRAKAVDHAARAQRLADDAKTVKGGARLVSVLQRLAERAQALRSKTEEIEKTAHRGTEAVSALAANTRTRHGGIYRAVADSPLTSPAEREFYQDKEGR